MLKRTPKNAIKYTKGLLKTINKRYRHLNNFALADFYNYAEPIYEDFLKLNHEFLYEMYDYCISIAFNEEVDIAVRLLLTMIIAAMPISTMLDLVMKTEHIWGIDPTQVIWKYAKTFFSFFIGFLSIDKQIAVLSLNGKIATSMYGLLVKLSNHVLTKQQLEQVKIFFKSLTKVNSFELSYFSIISSIIDDDDFIFELVITYPSDEFYYLFLHQIISNLGGGHVGLVEDLFVEVMDYTLSLDVPPTHTQFTTFSRTFAYYFIQHKLTTDVQFPYLAYLEEYLHENYIHELCVILSTDSLKSMLLRATNSTMRSELMSVLDKR